MSKKTSAEKISDALNVDPVEAEIVEAEVIEPKEIQRVEEDKETRRILTRTTTRSKAKST